jgi:hypothetical protein
MMKQPMQRLQIFLPVETLAWLRATKKRTGFSAAAIIRLAVDAYRAAKNL